MDLNTEWKIILKVAAIRTNASIWAPNIANSGDLFVVKCDKTSLDLLEFLMQINYRSEGEEKNLVEKRNCGTEERQVNPAMVCDWRTRNPWEKLIPQNKLFSTALVAEIFPDSNLVKTSDLLWDFSHFYIFLSNTNSFLGWAMIGRSNKVIQRSNKTTFFFNI